MRKLTVTISARLFDKHGNFTRKYRPRPAHSFLAQFIELLHTQMTQAATQITHTDAVERSITPSTYNFRCAPPASNLGEGMLIGSGTDPVDIDDYVLQTPITTNLTATIHTFVLSYPTPSSRRLAISRTFTNTIASPMPIEEVALYTVPAGVGKICLDRTLYSVVIPASSSLELTYRITVSV